MWLFMLSYGVGFSSVWAMNGWVQAYFIGLFLYGTLLFRTFPEKMEKSVAHAVMLGFTSAVLFKLLAGFLFVSHIWVLAMVPFLFLLSKGKTAFLDQPHHEWMVILTGAALPICSLVVMKLWGLETPLVETALMAIWFAVHAMAHLWIRARGWILLFALTQAGVLWYLLDTWIQWDVMTWLPFTIAIGLTTIDHFTRGSSTLIRRLNRLSAPNT